MGSPVNVSPGEQPGGTAGPSRRIAIALCIGTLVEWFDFGLYGFSSVVIAAAFFPAGDSGVALLETFAVYAVSFVVRPIGGVVFGRIGDRVGRRVALSISLVMMGLATAAIGLIPTYHSIGVAAPVALVVCRLVQGFAASSELAGATTYMAEAAPDHRRGLWTNVVGSFGSFGTAAATILVLAFKLDPHAYAAGGWRWPFVIGGAIAIAGLYLRLRLTETAVYQEVRAERHFSVPSLWQLIREHHRTMLLLVAFYALVGVGFQTLMGYMPTYMTRVAGIGSTAALLISLFAFIAFPSTLIFFGYLSDLKGRKPLIIIGACVIVVLTVPAYLMIGSGNLVLACVAQALLVVPIAAAQAGGNIANLEVFPTSIRFTAVAFSYAVSYAVFAGTAPLVDEFLLDAGGRLAPAYYGVLVALIALPILAKGFPESRLFSIRSGRLEPRAEPVAEPAG